MPNHYGAPQQQRKGKQRSQVLVQYELSVDFLSRMPHAHCKALTRVQHG